MIDWYIVLTPILLLPIALLFFFVGCATAYQLGDTFEINCYLENFRLSHSFEIRIYDSATKIHGEPTDIQGVIEGGAVTSRVRFRIDRKVAAGRATLSCQVIDRTTDELLIDRGATCEHDLEQHEAYLFVFNASVSDDGTEPDAVFEDCATLTR